MLLDVRPISKSKVPSIALTELLQAGCYLLPNHSFEALNNKNKINFLTYSLCNTTQEHWPYPRVVLFILYMYAFGISHTYGNCWLLSSTIDHPQDDPEHMQMYANTHVQTMFTTEYLLFALFTSITNTFQGKVCHYQRQHSHSHCRGVLSLNTTRFTLAVSVSDHL